MHLKLYDAAVDGSVHAKIKAVEDQGSYKIVNVTLAGKTIRARLPEGGRVSEGQVWLVFPQKWTRLFADGRLVK